MTHTFAVGDKVIMHGTVTHMLDHGYVLVDSDAMAEEAIAHTRHLVSVEDAVVTVTHKDGTQHPALWIPFDQKAGRAVR